MLTLRFGRPLADTGEEEEVGEEEEEAEEARDEGAVIEGRGCDWTHAMAKDQREHGRDTSLVVDVSEWLGAASRVGRSQQQQR